jgi:hypothetical protein
VRQPRCVVVAHVYLFVFRQVPLASPLASVLANPFVTTSSPSSSIPNLEGRGCQSQILNSVVFCVSVDVIY